MVYVAVLFARRDSNYKALSGVDVWDEDRDARNYVGQYPVVAHPPCRAFSQLRHFAKPMPHEKSLAFFAIEMIRKCGGVLEHPARSTLWGEANLPLPGERDMYGGWTYEAPQRWWGHKCEKPTRFYQDSRNTPCFSYGEDVNNPTYIRRVKLEKEKMEVYVENQWLAVGKEKKGLVRKYIRERCA